MVDRITGGTKKLHRSPKPFVVRIVVFVCSRFDTSGIGFEMTIRCRFKPRPAAPSRRQASIGIVGIKRSVHACSDRGYRHKIARGLCRQIRFISAANYQHSRVISFRKYRSGELGSGGLVPHPSALILHLEHPIQIPTDLAQHLR